MQILEAEIYRKPYHLHNAQIRKRMQLRLLNSLFSL